MQNNVSIKVLLLVCVMVATSVKAQLKITDMRVEHMHNPSVVDAQVPRLSWINEPVKAGVRGAKQTAYRIVVASSREHLTDEFYDIWDSGKCVSEESNLVSYGGTPLKDATDYYWQVRTWDERGKASEWSAVGTWRMGIRNENWQAQWIAAEGKDDMDGILMRKAFELEKQVVSAKVFVCGLGFFELYVNGQRVGEDYLVPNLSNYTQRFDLQDYGIKLDNDFSAYRCLYMAYDVTQLMQNGRNMMGVILGNGWFHPEAVGRTSAFGDKCLRLQLMLTYADGSRRIVPTDENWQTHPSPIRYSGIYGGELYDARLEMANWAETGSTNEGWTTAKVVEGPMGEMSAMTSPADKILECLDPFTLTKTGDKEYEVDFGKEISGWIHFHGLKGQAGDTLQVDFVCESPQGNNRYVLKGNGNEDYRPHFTWFVFSKARIRGVELSKENLTAESVGTDVPLMATFRSSNPLLNRINEIWQQSQIDNMHGCIASDCPHREKLPYTGDGQAASETVMYNFDAAAFYQKWIRDMRDAQNRKTGHVPNSAPWQPGAGGGVAWGAAMTLMPWWFYEQYGDLRMLEDSYESMKNQVRFMQTWITDDGIMQQRMTNFGTEEACYWLNLGDWVAPDAMPRDELVHTFYLWLCQDYCARAAEVLGEKDEADEFQRLARQTADNFHRYFYDEDEKSYGLAGSNIFALRMGVPQKYEEDVIATLRQEIMDYNEGRINTGFLATKYFFETLANVGLNDVAYAVMNGRQQPSFGWWVEQGATVTWEQWDGQNSHNHPMFGGGLTWLYRTLAGVCADAERPGFRHAIIRPVLTEMEEVEYSRLTPYGQLSSKVSQENGMCTIRVEIPVGSTATIVLPTDERVTESGKALGKAKGVDQVRWMNGSTLLEVQQGHYNFTFPLF